MNERLLIIAGALKLFALLAITAMFGWMVWQIADGRKADPAPFLPVVGGALAAQLAVWLWSRFKRGVPS